MTFSEAEQAGLTGIGDTAFVLVAGGLGERLGYSGIKLSLETNLCTNKSYLEVYAKYIQAMQRMAHLKTGKDHIRIPLVIMTSDDTDPMTRKLLEETNNFGFDEGQVIIVKQDKVAALSNGNAGLSMKSRWVVETKPHVSLNCLVIDVRVMNLCSRFSLMLSICKRVTETCTTYYTAKDWLISGTMRGRSM